jgi:hypothetical protein
MERLSRMAKYLVTVGCVLFFRIEAVGGLETARQKAAQIYGEHLKQTDIPIVMVDDHGTRIPIDKPSITCFEFQAVEID